MWGENINRITIIVLIGILLHDWILSVFNFNIVVLVIHVNKHLLLLRAGLAQVCIRAAVYKKVAVKISIEAAVELGLVVVQTLNMFAPGASVQQQMILVHNKQQRGHDLVHIVPQIGGPQAVIRHQPLHHRRQTLQPRGTYLSSSTLLLVIIVAHRAELTHERVIIKIVIGRGLIGRLLVTKLTKQTSGQFLILQIVAAVVIVGQIVADALADAGACAHVGPALLQESLYNFQIVSRVVVEVLGRDDQKYFVHRLDRVLHIVAVLVGAGEAPL